MRRHVFALCLALVLAAIPAPASAHGDVLLFEGTVHLAPGETARYPGELHYHRLVARIAADGPILVRLVREADGSLAIGKTGDVITFNDLVRCCDTATWTRYALLIDNPSDRAVAVDAHARLVHDDLAVMVYGAEAGTKESPWIIGGLWGVFAWRSARRARSRSSLRRAVATLSLAVAAVIVLVMYGGARYGLGGPPALLAASSDLPFLPVNPIVSRAALVVGVVVIAWSLALVWWAGSWRTRRRAAWLGSGALLLACVVATAVLVAGTYAATDMPITFVAAAAVPIVGPLILRVVSDHKT